MECCTALCAHLAEQLFARGLVAREVSQRSVETTGVGWELHDAGTERRGDDGQHSAARVRTEVTRAGAQPLATGMVHNHSAAHGTDHFPAGAHPWPDCKPKGAGVR